MKIYVGNLPWGFDDRGLNDLFATHGAIDSAQVVTDKETGRSRGFGFVEMGREDGQRAIAKLNGQEVDSRALKVNEAQAKAPRANRL